MAVEHSIAPGTVKWLLSVARQRLREFIRTEGEK
jgi:DNA-directed RNA polymerase specialized sigma24 family protein